MAETYVDNVNIKPNRNISTEYIELTSLGRLTVKKGYAWDGAAGTLFNTANLMRASLVHDALYQLMSSAQMDPLKWRKAADELLYSACRQDGVGRFRSWCIYKWVSLTAESHIAKEKTVLFSPKSATRNAIQWLFASKKA